MSSRNKHPSSVMTSVLAGACRQRPARRRRHPTLRFFPSKRFWKTNSSTTLSWSRQAVSTLGSKALIMPGGKHFKGESSCWSLADARCCLQDEARLHEIDPQGPSALAQQDRPSRSFLSDVPRTFVAAFGSRAECSRFPGVSSWPAFLLFTAKYCL